MGKRLFILLVVSACLFTLVYGCQSMVLNMSEGERLYRAKCSSCHSVIAPGSHNNEEWRMYVDKYGRKMTDEEKQVVLQYLLKTG